MSSAADEIHQLRAELARVQAASELQTRNVEELSNRLQAETSGRQEAVNTALGLQSQMKEMMGQFERLMASVANASPPAATPPAAAATVPTTTQFQEGVPDLRIAHFEGNRADFYSWKVTAELTVNNLRGRYSDAVLMNAVLVSLRGDAMRRMSQAIATSATSEHSPSWILAKLETEFGEPNRAHHANARLERFTQGSLSLLSYVSKFEALVSEAQSTGIVLADSTLRYRLYRGINQNLKVRYASGLAHCLTLARLKEELFAAALMEDEIRGGPDVRGERGSRDAGDPMDWEEGPVNSGRVGNGSNSSRNRRRRENLKSRSQLTCDYCGLKGHVKDKCYSRKNDLEKKREKKSEGRSRPSRGRDTKGTRVRCVGQGDDSDEEDFSSSSDESVQGKGKA